MKSLKRIIRTLHAWLGLALSLLILLASITGSLLIWKEDYVKLVTPAAQVDFEPTPEALAKITSAIESQFVDDYILHIQFATADFPLTRVTLDDTNYAYVDIHGQVVDKWHMNDRPEEWLYDLHHRLLLDNIGLTIMGVTAAALVILIILGIVAFMPLRRLFRRGILPRSTSRASLMISHRNLGIVLTVPLLMMALTGLIQAFPAQMEELLLGDIRSNPTYSDNMVVGLDDISGEETSNWLSVMKRTLAVFPGATIRSANVPAGPYGERIIGVQQPGEWNRNGLSLAYFEANLGYMDLRFDTLSVPRKERLYNTAYPFHTGKTGSYLYKLLLTLCGLGASFLSTLAIVSFIKGRLPKHV